MSEVTEKTRPSRGGGASIQGARTSETAPRRVYKRTYKRREGAAPRWPEKPYKWAFLQACMVEMNYDPSRLAFAMGFDANRVYEWLNLTNIPRRGNVVKLARLLKVKTGELLGSMPIEG